MNEQLLQAAKLLKEHCESQDGCNKCIFHYIDECEEYCRIGIYICNAYSGMIPSYWKIESEVK